MSISHHISVHRMKKVLLPKGVSTLKEAIRGDLIRPNGNVKVEAVVENNIITIAVKEDVKNVREAYLVAYDKKVGCILAFQEIALDLDNVCTVELSKDFINQINETVDFKYARLCIALKYESDCGFAYLYSHEIDEYDDESSLAGVVFEDDSDSKLIAYYAQNGVLSIKYVSNTDYYNKYCKCIIESMSQQGDILKLRISCVAKAGVESKIELVALGKEDEDNIDVAIKQRSVLSLVRERLECEISIEDISCGRYCLACRLGEDLLAIEVSESCEMSEMTKLGQIYSIGKDEEEKYDIACTIDDEMRFNISVAKKLYPYMCSIVMAIYNTEQFLEEALDSIVNQKLDSIKKYIIGNKADDYEKQIYLDAYEVVMVDDGSSDSSGQICDRYVEMYPHFHVIHKQNGGVSSARNKGIEVATGKYMNFMDSDDKLSDNVVAECFKFFEAHYDDTDIITFPPKIFDAASGEHWLNDKFSKDNRVINLMNEYDKNVLLVNASFFKSEKIKGKVKFEESLKIAEDVRFIYTLYFNETPRFGTLNSCAYWYRKRSIGEKSLMQESKSVKNYYVEFFTDCIEWLLSESKKRYGFVPQYVQYVVAQQIQWRFRDDEDASLVKAVLDEKEFEEYVQSITRALKEIDASIILEQKKVFREQKKYMLELKSGEPLKKHYDGKDVMYFYDSLKVTEASTNYVRLEFLKFDEDSIYLEGYNMSLEKDSEVYIKLNDEYILLDRYERDKNVYALGEPIFFATPFIYKAKLDRQIDKFDIFFYEKIDGNFVQKRDIRYAKTMPISQAFSKSYYVNSEWGVTQQKQGLCISNLQDMNVAISFYNKSEAEFVKQLSEKCKSKVEKDAIEFRKELVSFLANYKKKKPIWLISDRVNLAGDNGEAFFRYVMAQNDPDIDVYFVINKDSKDYKAMCEVGKVVIQNSKEHLMLHLIADYVISSQANEYIINPFVHMGTTDIFRDMVYAPKFVFLQHGITKDDVSGWLNRYNKDMTGLVTAAIPEYQSMFDYDYFYTEKEIWLTGFPRHDRLYFDEKRYITIMPTWRKYLSAPSKDDPEINVVVDNFKESDFFKFYNELINNRRLIDAAKQYNYTICFMPHPNLMNNLDMFDHAKEVKFFGTEKPYREIYAESDLVMTDYSSSVMDFAYLRKPLVYCQFDHEEFFAGDHVYTKGYFDYERDGFGEVTYDLESLVDTFIEYMKNECQLKDTYKERMDKFFAYRDCNNCERLYKRIKEDN